MDPVLAFLAILAALAMGAASPGPSFVLVARTAVARSRADGVAAAVGMGAGGVVFAALALVGLYALLSTVGWLYLGLKILGGGYLLLLAWRLWRGAGEPMAVRLDGAGEPPRFWRSLGLGLATQISNPKTALVYGGIFAALLPAEPPGWIVAALPPAVFLIEAGWYTLVAVVFSSAGPRAAYLRGKGWFDRAAAAALGLLGARLMLAVD
ncbi:threonine/homoserine/homoserine lactone efflux protein [Azospirillum fermentarium]|uniref:LysE family transporter n=1 Tax=Azospirillum fermentarium TaxID=1233114 RepID=UPI002227B9AC|nr:LysE family transporter [Azospirillum fermentarium]MCW2248379.1 threonine/homoserine/homoserine lactone efflux protein [Azospirillum fermentarium]